MSAERTTIAPIEKSARVPLAPTRAFEAFTAEMASWWPLATHSVGLADAVSVTVEPRRGGGIVEELTDGTTSRWGTVLDWEPPDRVRFTWHPGSDPAEATEVEIRFRADGDVTIVELTHAGWERRPDGLEMRGNYDSGWDFVFGHYLDLVAGAQISPPGI